MGKKPSIYGGRWKIVDTIGEGGQAQVYQVRDIENKDKSKQWVLKLLKNPERIERFKREVEVLKTLQSPYIPPIEDYSEESPAYIVTPFLGQNLEKHPKREYLTINHLLQAFEQLVAAIQESHNKGIAHRDIKPNNVILSEDLSTAYLIDFGISQNSGDQLALTTASEPFGNPAFAAPECFLGRIEEPSFPADIYSLGKLLYWMVSSGRYINRENLSDNVFSKIRSNNQLSRFYIERLLRGTIRENTYERWDATTLLQQVKVTQALIERYENHILDGYIPVYDSFGIGESFSKNSSKSAT